MKTQVNQDEKSRVFDPYVNFPDLPKGAKMRLYCPPTNIIYSDPETGISNLMAYIPNDRRPTKPRFAEVLEDTIVIAIDAARQNSTVVDVARQNSTVVDVARQNSTVVDVARQNSTLSAISFGAWFGTLSLYNASGLLPKDVPQTHRAAELHAAKVAFEVFRDKIHSSPNFSGIKKVLIMLESSYIMDNMSKDIWKSKANEDMTARKSPVADEDAMRELHGLVTDLEEKKITVQFWMVNRKYNKDAISLAKGLLGMTDEVPRANKKRTKKKHGGDNTRIEDNGIEDNAHDAAPEEFSLMRLS